MFYKKLNKYHDNMKNEISNNLNTDENYEFTYSLINSSCDKLVRLSTPDTCLYFDLTGNSSVSMFLNLL